ncbi:hypothetical protein FRC02_005140 [Tulasnella sp. 418]|nr:hypothetical protein FRC02_005140 [Tulasnella sp. 418]
MHNLSSSTTIHISYRPNLTPRNIWYYQCILLDGVAIKSQAPLHLAPSKTLHQLFTVLPRKKRRTTSTNIATNPPKEHDRLKTGFGGFPPLTANLSRPSLGQPATDLYRPRPKSTD